MLKCKLLTVFRSIEILFFSYLLVTGCANLSEVQKNIFLCVRRKHVSYRYACACIVPMFTACCYVKLRWLRSYVFIIANIWALVCMNRQFMWSYYHEVIKGTALRYRIYVGHTSYKWILQKWSKCSLALRWSSCMVRYPIWHIQLCRI